MAFQAIRVLIFVLTCLLQVHYSVLICSESCLCTADTKLCDSCSYNATFKEPARTFNVNFCCRGDSINLSLLQSYSNLTFKEFTVVKGEACTQNYFDFSLPTLDVISINMQNNSIRKINLNVKTKNLRIINLSSNHIQFISKGMFNDYSNLVKLLLNRNEIKTIYESSFDGLYKLETLDLSENRLISLPNVFTVLKNLQHLNLSRNSIEFIHENYFNNWLLQHLDVSHNNLKKVAPGALQSLPNLARLLLTDNPHLGVTQLDAQLLVGTGRRLQQIDASRTGLYQVPEAFTHSVRFLSLVGNKISGIRCGDLDSYPLLQSLDFSDNKITTFEDDSLGRLEMLLFLNLNKNLLTAVPKTLPDELKYLSISNNVIRNLTKTDFKNMPNLRILLLQNNKIIFIQNNVFDDLLSLEMLDLSNNPIQILTTSTFDGPLSLKDLRLCFLNVSMLENDTNFPLSSPESIQMLHLQASPSLARQLLADSAVLAALSHLQYLDLRMNNLSEVRKDLLFYLAQLKTLRLHGNGINCSAEVWLREWMSWNKSLTQNETCYYSTSESKEDDQKYNCTFSETFTINESLPPVNLYSTEMINKLLRYYGYLNNKTDRVTFKRHENRTDLEFVTHNNNSENFTRDNTVADTTSHYLTHKTTARISNKINDSQQFKTHDILNFLDQNSLLSDQNSGDRSPSNIDISNNEIKIKDSNLAQTWDLKKNKTGKRLNTPVNITTQTVFNHSRLSNSSRPELTGHEMNESYTITKTEFSSYQSVSTSYAQYLGTVSVTVLIIASLILWASFRLRYRRRRATSENNQTDQIEVSNISGGVLW